MTTMRQRRAVFNFRPERIASKRRHAAIKRACSKMNLNSVYGKLGKPLSFYAEQMYPPPYVGAPYDPFWLPGGPITDRLAIPMAFDFGPKGLSGEPRRIEWVDTTAIGDAIASKIISGIK